MARGCSIRIRASLGCASAASRQKWLLDNCVFGFAVLEAGLANNRSDLRFGEAASCTWWISGQHQDC